MVTPLSREPVDRIGQFRAKLLARIEDAGGLPLKNGCWPNGLNVTSMELTEIRRFIDKGVLPDVAVLDIPLITRSYMDSPDGAVLEVLPQPHRDLPYEETPALLAMRARKRALGR